MFYLSKLLGHTVRDAEGKSAGTLQDVVVSTRQKYPRVTTLASSAATAAWRAPWDTVASLEESGVLLRVAAAALDEYAPQARRAAALGPGPRPPDRRHRRPQDDPRERHPACALGPLAARGRGRRLERRHPAPHRPGAREHAPLQEPQAPPDRLERRRPAGERLRSRAPHGAAPRPVAAAPGRHRRDRPRAHAPRSAPPSSRPSKTRSPPTPSRRCTPPTRLRCSASCPTKRRPTCSKTSRPTTPPTCSPTCPSAAPRACSALMEHEKADEIRELLTYPENSAGGIMTTDFAVVPPEVTAAEAIELLRDQEPEVETVYYIYVTDKREHLLRRHQPARPAHRARRPPRARLHDRRPHLRAPRGRRRRGHPDHRQVQPARPARGRRRRRACTGS